MARGLFKIKLNLHGNPDGTVNKAIFEYEVQDGNAKKESEYVIINPDFNKVFHNSGTAGEFWFDSLVEIKIFEGI